MAVTYRITFPDPKAHLAQVEIDLDSPPVGLLEVWMPVWSPGSYLVREYARNIQNVEAFDGDGTPLEIEKTRKNCWRIEASNPERLRVRYRIYGKEKSVRTNWIDADYAFLNAPSTFMLVRGAEARPVEVTVETPPEWNQAYCPLASSNGEPTITYTAPDLDTLLDSPILCGSPEAYTFTVDGKPVSLINQGEGGLWDGAKATEDVQTIVEAYGSMYGGFPFERYLFYNLIVEGRGGLEHKDGSVLMTNRYAYRNREAYVSWLSLVSHEFFHVWNVKRSRPIELGPFDYESEVYTRNLWVAEGITAYYTDLVPKRAGLFSEAEYLKTLSGKITTLQNTPGRLLQSLEESSFDAWIKLYRPDENSVNSTVSYYLKGCLVGWLLDVEIRRFSEGTKSLDDFMRHLYQEFSGAQGFTREQVQEAAEALAGTSLEAFFDQYVRGKEELDFSSALEYLGLTFDMKTADPTPWLGLTQAVQENQLVVTAVRNDGPARQAGLMQGDELLAVNGFRLTPANQTQVLQQFEPGDTVDLLVSRDGAVREASLQLGTPPQTYSLAVDASASEAIARQRAQWWES